MNGHPVTSFPPTQGDVLPTQARISLRHITSGFSPLDNELDQLLQDTRPGTVGTGYHASSPWLQET